MKINNFKHDDINSVIEFEIENDGEVNKVTVESIKGGTQFTDIDDFAEDWADEEYSQLEEFINGCSEMLHQFYH